MPDTSPQVADADQTSTPARRAGRMETALTNARGAASDAFEETRKAARRVGEAAEANPLAIVAGGVAIGLAAGALLPKTKRETELLGPVGKRLTDAAADAASAAKDAARVELATLPLSREAAREQAGKVIDQVARAIAGAGEAAFASRQSSEPTDDSPAPRPRKAK